MFNRSRARQPTTTTTAIMLRRVLTTGLLVLLAAAATAADIIQDTKENRVLQAQRVVTGTPIEETLEGIVQEAIKIKGPEVAGCVRVRVVCVCRAAMMAGPPQQQHQQPC